MRRTLEGETVPACRQGVPNGPPCVSEDSADAVTTDRPRLLDRVRRFFRKLMVMGCALVVLLALLAYSFKLFPGQGERTSPGWSQLRRDQPQRLFTRQRPTLVKHQYSQGEIQHLIQTVPPQYGLPAVIAEVIVHLESRGDPFAMRYEQTWIPQARKVALTPWERYYYRHSVGMMQVAAWHVKLTPAVQEQLGAHLAWHDLFDPHINLAVGSIIWMEAFKQTRGRLRARLQDAFRRYNGSGPQAQQYAVRAMRKLDARLSPRELARVTEALGIFKETRQETTRRGK